jgi:hypothetical protein
LLGLAWHWIEFEINLEFKFLMGRVSKGRRSIVNFVFNSGWDESSFESLRIGKLGLGEYT